MWLAYIHLYINHVLSSMLRVLSILMQKSEHTKEYFSRGYQNAPLNSNMA